MRRTAFHQRPGRTAPIPRSDLIVAVRRVGGTPDARLRWLTAFVRRDLADDREAERARHELLVFAATGYDAVAPRQRTPLQRLAAQAAGEAIRGPSLWMPNATATVRRVQEQLARALQRLATERVWTLPLPDLRYEWQPDGSFLPTPLGDPERPSDAERLVSGAAFRLLAALGPRLRICGTPSCARLFLGAGKQRYCTPTCSGRARQARFRRTHAERVRKAKRAAYVRRQQERLGSKVRVQRQSHRRARGDRNPPRSPSR